MNPMLVELWPWWFGGIIIGLLVPIMYFFLDAALGVSTGYGNLVKLAFPNTKSRWFNSDTFDQKNNWRSIFILGMIIGAFFSARGFGMPFATAQMGLFTEHTNWPYLFYVLWFFIGGTFIGLGSRLAGGCTSGHGIHGMATFQKPSLVAIVTFLLFATIFTNLIRLVIMGGN